MNNSVFRQLDEEFSLSLFGVEIREFSNRTMTQVTLKNNDRRVIATRFIGENKWAVSVDARTMATNLRRGDALALAAEFVTFRRV
jgi:hypothetical protein